LFASEGANVLLVDINLKAAESVAALIATRYPNVKAIATKTDVGVEGEIKGAVNLAVKEFGRLDVMVCLPPSHLPTRMTPLRPPPPLR
jgi:NAD(P)-dependent dehydrogenase (short-subunit alcohol dehydrogenase family)